MPRSVGHRTANTVQRLRRAASGKLLEGFFHGVAALGSLHPRMRLSAHDVERLTDLSYAPGGAEHRLDIYRPRRRAAPLPVVLYLHGGGFRILSKNTHWLMGLLFARAGYVVFNANYRLAPAHCYPAAVEDAATAFEWVAENATRFGGDPERIVVAGESAGANLALGLCLAASYERKEPWARRVFARDLVPRVALPICGMLQVSAPERVLQLPDIHGWIKERVIHISESYLGEHAAAGQALDFADPLCMLERGEAPARPLPAVFAGVGTADPLREDTFRLQRALATLGVHHDVRSYPGEVHAFHAFIWRAAAQSLWGDMLNFTADVLAQSSSDAPQGGKR